MADKKKATENSVDETERRAVDRKTLMGAGAFLAAIALFAGGYAIGNSADDSVVSADRGILEDAPQADPAPVPRADRFGLNLECTPDGRCTFQVPEGLEFEGPFPECRFDEDGFPRRPGDCFGLDVPDDLPFPRGGRGFGFGFMCDEDGNCTFHAPEDFEFGERFPFPRGDRGFGFGLECDEDGNCTFRIPDDFEFPGPFDDDRPFEDPPAVDQPGYLGVAVVEDGGVLVTDVSPGSPAADAGIESGDLIIEVDGRQIETIQDLIDVVADAGAGSEVLVTVLRQGDEVSFGAVLTSRPS